MLSIVPWTLPVVAAAALLPCPAIVEPVCVASLAASSLADCVFVLALPCHVLTCPLAPEPAVETRPFALAMALLTRPLARANAPRTAPICCVPRR